MRWKLSKPLQETPIDNFCNSLNFNKESIIIKHIMDGKISFNNLKDQYSSDRSVFDINGYTLRFKSNNYSHRKIIKTISPNGHHSSIGFRSFEFELNSSIYFRVLIPEFSRHYLDDNIQPEQIVISKLINTYNFDNSNKINILQYLHFGLEKKFDEDGEYLLIHSKPKLEDFYSSHEIY